MKSDALKVWNNRSEPVRFLTGLSDRMHAILTISSRRLDHQLSRVQQQLSSLVLRNRQYLPSAMLNISCCTFGEIIGDGLV